MNPTNQNRVLLVDVLPTLATELRQLLIEQGEPESAAQMPGLMILDRCRCGDDFCATFYTKLKPRDSFDPGYRNLRLFPADGALLVLDVVDGEIACVELLDRPEIREKLDAVVLN